MFAYVHALGWMPRVIAAFSAGRPERVVAERVQDVVPAHLPVAPDRVADPGEVLDVPHVHVAGRVRIHLEHEALLVCVGTRGAAHAFVCLPSRQPLRLDRSEVVRLAHRVLALRPINKNPSRANKREVGERLVLALAYVRTRA